MQPPSNSRDHEHESLDEGVSRIGLMVMWSEGPVLCGRDATDLLHTMRGGWNPSSLTAMRRVLAQRAGISPPKRGETNRRFLDRLEAAGTIRIFDVDRHFPEFSEPPFDDAG